MTPFALYRLPNSNEYFEIRGSSSRFGSVEEIHDKKGFMLSSFSGDEVLLISSDSVRCGHLSELRASEMRRTFSSFATISEEKSAYGQSFAKFYSAIENGLCQKIVLSRSHKMVSDGVVDSEYIEGLFFRACTTYHNAFVYVAYTDETGYWFGCSPEVLVESDDNGYRSVALAGTMSAGDGEWSGKNIREQKYVSDFMREMLEPVTVKLWQSEVYTAKAAALQHLKTDFRYTINESSSLSEVVQLLHPTPAVCGLPRAVTNSFILENEGYDRSFYSGVVGVWSAPHLYVNLRCANFRGSDVTLYAGGGLVEGSEMESEWNETESKMKTIMNIL